MVRAIKNIAIASSQKAERLKTAELRVKMVEDLGVKWYSVREALGVWRQNSFTKYTCQMQGVRKCKLLRYIMKHGVYRKKNTVRKY